MKTINIDSELHKQLKILCAERDITITQFIVEGIRSQLGKIPLQEGDTPITLPPKVKIPEELIKELTKKRGDLNAEDYV